MSRWTFIRRGSRLVVFGILASLFNIAPVTASSAHALGNFTLVCKSTLKAAKGFKIKKSELPSHGSCSYSFTIQVRVNENGFDKIYFGTALFDAQTPRKKDGIVFSGTAASLIAASDLYVYDPDTNEPITLGAYELLNASPNLDETTGGSWTPPSGVVCTVGAKHMSRSELFPYNPAVYGGSDYEKKSYIVTEAIDWQCRK